MDAYKYFRSLYKKIEKEDIDEFSKKYRHSELENEDLIKFYNEYLIIIFFFGINYLKIFEKS